ncbi:FmdB family zinc ribbon protein [Microbacterium rhizomatis]|uniref:FmdB family transcriptional regulator n=1 Tax=Microbacterium rhizomatis TaxID=1631477 RepID=A0A5J5IWX3_9MICO|nr:FmdB family zinc ribbon protein [Microbacterium rhizomatis]KAA9105566.1 FmdB family transcriptional regulator [Microbacterium rhizomatis]
MPTYAYACRECGHRFDAVQSFADPTLTECPVCGGPLRKEYGSIGVTFNGSGFYRTDSRAAAKGGADAGASGSSKGSDSSSGSSDKGGSTSSSGDSGSSGASSKTEAKSSPAPSGS